MAALRSSLVAIAVILAAPAAHAVGEEASGFPKWAERVEHEWTNRARCDPAVEMAKCGANCGEAACFSPKPPLHWNEQLNRAARFHSVHQRKNGYFGHDSKCKLVTSLKTTYPTTCDGEASCSCEGGALSGTTSFSARVAVFGAGTSGEIIAGSSDPNSAFYMWLYEPSSSATCGFSMANGHRWLILTNSSGAVGYGVDGNSTGDFGGGAAPYKIPSGAHYPRSGSSVELWANWYDTAAPKAAMVNVGGTCHAMARQRGSDTNGAWMYAYAPTGLSGCTRYFFTFKDSTGAQIDYPTTGSLGIGDASCADWTDSRPAAGEGCDCAPSCGGRVCGDDGCGGSCGSCGGGQTCSGGKCVTPPPPDAGPKDSGAPDATGGDASARDDASVPLGDGGFDPAGSALDEPAQLEGSCGCRTPATGGSSPGLALVALALVAARRRR
ncbi:MAG: CAP domain-containing protein [Deltaproteobacteria bacterium]|nr:CAP domain-containing protein [Deltaproteobacteria bacterium]